MLIKEEFSATLAAIHAAEISNILNGSDVLFAFGLVKGYSMQVIEGTMSFVRSKLVHAQLWLDVRRKLTRFLHTKAVTNNALLVGDLVEVYKKSGRKKRGTWLKPRDILSIDRDVGMITIAGTYEHFMKAACEDIYPGLGEDSLASMVQESIIAHEWDIAQIRDPELLESSRYTTHAAVTEGKGSDDDDSQIF